MRFISGGVYICEEFAHALTIMLVFKENLRTLLTVANLLQPPGYQNSS